MCNYTALGTILFGIIPLCIDLVIVIILALLIFKSKKLNLTWKIILFVLSLILLYFISILFSFYVIDKLALSQLFDRAKIWQCDDTLWRGMQGFK
jgi:ABC-type sugar transport system permease subunit